MKLSLHLARHPGEGRDPWLVETSCIEVATTVDPGLRRDDDVLVIKPQ
jgi:hypothetical protein